MAREAGGWELTVYPPINLTINFVPLLHVYIMSLELQFFFLLLAPCIMVWWYRLIRDGDVQCCTEAG